MTDLIIKSLNLQEAEFKTNLKKREWEGYGSTFGNMDSYGDIIERGAFRKTILERGPVGTGQIKALWEHWEPLGKIVQLEEDSNGLWVKGQATDTLENQDRLKYMADGVVDSMSIGFVIPSGKSWWEEDEDAPYGMVRHIEEIKLYEVSVVMFPANELAAISSVRKHGELHKLLKTVSADDLMQEIKSAKDLNLDVRALDSALEVLGGVRVELFGTPEERKALGLRNEPPQGTQPQEDEPPVETRDTEDDVEKKAADLFRSSFESEVVRERLSSVFS